MTDPLKCLRGTSIVVGIWNIIYALIQIGVMGWQTQEVKNLMSYWENREIPDSGLIYSDFKARFPGLYGLYTETPERRRVNAMYAIVLICLILSIAHLPCSILLLYAAIKKRKNFIWPFFFTGLMLIIMSTTYAVLWWSGDVFTEQLVMSVAEFVMSCAICGPAWFVVLFFYIRLNGQLTSVKPSRGGSGRRRSSATIPSWRMEWPDRPPPELEKKLRRKSRERSRKELSQREKETERREKERRRMERERRKEEEERLRRYRPFDQQNVDYFVPRPGDQTFPWNSPVPRPEPVAPPRKRTAAEVIENLYYEHYPEDLPKEIGALKREQR